jgi:hypothetical protein
MPFDLIARRRCPPARKLWVVHCRQRVRNYRRKRDARIEQAEITGMRHLNLPSLEHLFDISNDVVERH